MLSYTTTDTSCTRIPKLNFHPKSLVVVVCFCFFTLFCFVAVGLCFCLKKLKVSLHPKVEDVFIPCVFIDLFIGLFNY